MAEGSQAGTEVESWRNSAYCDLRPYPTQDHLIRGGTAPSRPGPLPPTTTKENDPQANLIEEHRFLLFPDNLAGDRLAKTNQGQPHEGFGNKQVWHFMVKTFWMGLQV